MCDLDRMKGLNYPCRTQPAEAPGKDKVPLHKAARKGRLHTLRLSIGRLLQPALCLQQPFNCCDLLVICFAFFLELNLHVLRFFRTDVNGSLDESESMHFLKVTKVFLEALELSLEFVYGHVFDLFIHVQTITKSK